MKNIFRHVRCGGFLFVVVCLFTTTNPLHAQWIHTNAPYSSRVHSLAVSGTNLFVGTEAEGVFLSTNNGTSWTAVNNGLAYTNTIVFGLAASGTNIFAGVFLRGVYLSTDNGTSWTQVNSGLTNTQVYNFVVSGTNIFAGTLGGGVFLSSNNGASWTTVNTGLTSTSIYSLAVSGTNIFAGTYPGGVFLSSNNGTSWTSANSGLTGLYAHALVVLGTNLHAGTAGGVYFSTNNGATWTAMSTSYVYDFAFSGTNLFVGTNDGVLLSTNNGTSWTSASTGLPKTRVNMLGVSGPNLIAGTDTMGVWKRPLSEMVTSVERPSTDLPIQFSLDQNYPNPFNPSTTITYELSRASSVTLRVFNTLGQQVEVLVDEEKEAGVYQVHWNAGVPSGVYFYRIQAGEFVETRKMLLLR